jgi:hypothetical protein
MNDITRLYQLTLFDRSYNNYGGNDGTYWAYLTSGQSCGADDLPCPVLGYQDLEGEMITFDIDPNHIVDVSLDVNRPQ